MKKIRLFVFALLTIAFVPSKAETVNVSGQFNGAFTPPLEFYISYSNLLDSTYNTFWTDSQGAFNINLDDMVSQGYLTLSFYNCNGDFISVGDYWNPGDLELYFELDYCMEGEVDSCNAYFAVNYELSDEESYTVYVDNLSTGLDLTYFWSFGDGTGSNEEAPIHYYATTGTWLLCLTVYGSDGCESTYCDSLIVDENGDVFGGGIMQAGFTLIVNGTGSANSVEEDNATDFAIWPNPVGESGVLFLNNTENWTGKIELINTVGQTVQTLSTKELLKNSMTTLNMQHMEDGIYIVRLTKLNGDSVSRLIVK